MEKVVPPPNCFFILQSPDDPRSKINVIAIHVHRDLAKQIEEVVALADPEVVSAEPGDVIVLDGAESMDDTPINLSLAFIPPKIPAVQETVTGKLIETSTEIEQPASEFAEEARMLEQLVRGRITTSIMDKNVAAMIVGDNLLKNHLPDEEKRAYAANAEKTENKLQIWEQIPLFAKIPGASSACAALRTILLNAPKERKEWLLRKVVIAYCQDIVKTDLAKREESKNPLDGLVGVWLKEIMANMPVVDDSLFEEKEQQGAAPVASDGLKNFKFTDILTLIKGEKSSSAAIEKGVLLAREMCDSPGSVDSLKGNKQEWDAFELVRAEIDRAAKSHRAAKTNEPGIAVNLKLRAVLRQQTISGGAELQEKLVNLGKAVILAKAKDATTASEGAKAESVGKKDGGGKGPPPKK